MTIVLGVGVKQRAGKIGRQGAGLGGTIVFLDNLQIAVARAQGHAVGSDIRDNRAVPAINAREDPLVITENQPRFTRERVADGQGLVHVRRAG